MALGRAGMGGGVAVGAALGGSKGIGLSGGVLKNGFVVQFPVKNRRNICYTLLYKVHILKRISTEICQVLNSSG